MLLQLVSQHLARFLTQLPFSSSELSPVASRASIVARLTSACRICSPLKEGRPSPLNNVIAGPSLSSLVGASALVGALSYFGVFASRKSRTVASSCSFVTSNTFSMYCFACDTEFVEMET